MSLTLDELKAKAQALVDLLDSSVETFNSDIPDIEKEIFSDVILTLKSLDMNGSRIDNTVKNIRLIGKLKNDIEKIISDGSYNEKLAEFAGAYNSVAGLHNQYFTALLGKFSPDAVLQAMQNEAISATVESLTEAGISYSLIEPVQNLLRTAITSGGQFQDLVSQLRQYITGDKNIDGALLRYTKQVTTDSINQFSAQYSSLITADLEMDWYMYVGSNLRTTRPFCKALSEKLYYHRAELQDILEGHIDGHTIAINPKTGVWEGGIPGTTVYNFKVNRGGYNCGHQPFPVSESMIPLEIRISTYSKLGIPYNAEGFRQAA